MPIVTEESARTAEGDGPLGPWRTHLLGDTGGLTQFGAHLETLEPGARSSFRHWHDAEDEFAYMLEGVLILHEGGSETPFLPGQAACFPAGAPLGHYLENRSDAPARFLMVGSRAPHDVTTYPDHDRVLHWTREGRRRRYTTLDGAPAGPPGEG